MSTNSIVAVQTPTGWRGRYVHSGGTPKHMVPALLALLDRDGYDTVARTLVDEHYGWSSVYPDMPSIKGKRAVDDYTRFPYDTPQYWAHRMRKGVYSDGRFALVPGYGVAYTTAKGQSSPDEWTTSDDTPGWALAFVLTPGAVLVYDADDAGTGWVQVGRFAAGQTPDPALLAAAECGADFGKCSHYAWVHFPEADGLRVGTAVWTGQEPARADGADRAVLPDGTVLALTGSGGLRYKDGRRPNLLTGGSRFYYGDTLAADGRRREVLLWEETKAGARLAVDLIVRTAAGDIRLAAGTVPAARGVAA